MVVVVFCLLLAHVADATVYAMAHLVLAPCFICNASVPSASEAGFAATDTQRAPLKVEPRQTPLASSDVAASKGAEIQRVRFEIIRNKFKELK